MSDFEHTPAHSPAEGRANVGRSREAAAGIARMELLTCDLPPRGLGFQFHKLDDFDRGVDCLVEVIGTEADGKIVGAQVKSGTSYFRRGDDDSWWLYIRKETVRYWFSYSVPVLLIVVDPVSGVAYWARGNDMGNVETAKSYRIRVPKSQRYDTHARAAIQRLAQNAPPTLSEIIDRSRLDAELAEIRQALVAARTVEDHRTIAGRYLALANLMAARGRRREAARQRAGAIRALRRARDTERAAMELVALLRFVVDELRDGDLAANLLLTATAADKLSLAGEQEPPAGWAGVSDATLHLLEIAVADAHDLDGTCWAADRLADRLSADAALNVSGDLTIVPRLRAAVAVSGARHAEAQTHFNKAAELSTDPAIRLALRVRSALHRGLSGDLAGGIAVLESIAANGIPPTIISLWLPAMGWLRVLTGGPIEGAGMFRAAGKVAVNAESAVVAARAFRCAVWAGQHQPQDGNQLVAAGALARDLRSPGDEERRRREIETSENLLKSVDHYLHVDDPHQAYREALRALRLAFDEIDPEVIELAHLRLADIWRRAAAEMPDPTTLLTGMALTARTRGLMSDEAVRRQLVPFYALVRERANDALRERIVAALTEGLMGERELASALQTLAEVSDLIPDDAVGNCVVPLILAALRAGWHEEAAGSAVEMTRELGERLSPTDAAKIADRLRAMVVTTPKFRLDKLYGALACVLRRAALPEESWPILSAELLLALGSPGHGLHLPALYGALATLAQRIGGQLRLEVTDALTHEGAKARWPALAALVAADLEVDATLVDDYLRMLCDVLRVRLAEVKTNARSGIGSLHLGVVAWAAARAGREVRDECLSLSIDYVEENQQLSYERARFVPVVGLLGRESERLRTRATDVLLRVARGGLRESHVFAGLGGHPLGLSRPDDFPSPYVRHAAITWLVHLYGVSNSQQRDHITAEAVVLLSDAQPDVREAAATLLGTLFGGTDDPITPGAGTRHEGPPEDVVAALTFHARDASTEVRLAALGALARFSRQDDSRAPHSL
jgi:tetratricopeptide (TPR) repeat protein